MESLRQKVFSYLDNNQNLKNKELYNKFIGENESSLRQYKKQYYEEVARKEELSQLFEDKSDIVIYTKLDLMRKHSKTLFNEDIPDDIIVGRQYNKIAKKNKKPNRSNFHIFPLLKTFKLLPLYIFLKVYDISKEIRDSEFPITEIYNSLIDNMNVGIYDINEISQFSFNCKKELKGFLDHDSWKINAITNVNNWLGICKELIVTNWNTGEGSFITKHDTIEERELEKEYLKIKGKILLTYLPEFYGIYYYFKKKEVIVKDLGKACFLNNFGDNEPVSLTNLIERFNNDLEYRSRPSRYHILFDYNESNEFLYPKNEE